MAGHYDKRETRDDSARERERTHGGRLRAGDVVARVAQPDEMFLRDAQNFRDERIEPHVNARQCRDGQRVGIFGLAQPCRCIARDGAVIFFNDGFK